MKTKIFIQKLYKYIHIFIRRKDFQQKKIEYKCINHYLTSINK